MINRYKLQAKRPHEDVFTEWCSTDNYEAVVRNIKVIESYGWEWQLKTEEDEIIKQLKSVAKAIESLKIEQPSTCLFGRGVCGYPIDDCYNCPTHEWSVNYCPLTCEFK
jgi:hypothetical protein